MKILEKKHLLMAFLGSNRFNMVVGTEEDRVGLKISFIGLNDQE